MVNIISAKNKLRTQRHNDLRMSIHPQYCQNSTVSSLKAALGSIKSLGIAAVIICSLINVWVYNWLHVLITKAEAQHYSFRPVPIRLWWLFIACPSLLSPSIPVLKCCVPSFGLGQPPFTKLTGQLPVRFPQGETKVSTRRREGKGISLQFSFLSMLLQRGQLHLPTPAAPHLPWWVSTSCLAS